MADTKFKPGNAGRPKGIPNRFTKLRDEMLEAFEQLGGVDGLVKWARSDPDRQGMFYQMIARMLPKPIEVSGDSELIVRIVKQGDPPSELPSEPTL